jgi:hypothetical protein
MVNPTLSQTVRGGDDEAVVAREPFLENAASILEAARSAASVGEATQFSILIGRDGAIRMVADSDWPLDSLGDHHGAAMAFRVSQTAEKRVRVEGRAGSRTCLFEAAKPDWAARLLLANPPSYTLVPAHAA